MQEPDITPTDRNCAIAAIIAIVLFFGFVAMIALSGCSPHYSERYGYQREPFKEYTGKKRKHKNPKMIQLYPMNYYAQTPNP